jgi:transcriptional regulator with XRE-family HTH domain
MSQSQLGEALDVTFQQVQKYEKGSNRISVGRLELLARVLKVPPSFFFADAPSAEASVAGFAEPKAEFDFGDAVSIREALHLNRVFTAIRDPKVRKKIVELAESLASETV